MARPKKPTYTWVEKLQRYRKRIKDADGKYIDLYGKTPDELTRKIEQAQAEIKEMMISRENPTVEQYCQRWLDLNNGGSAYQVNAINTHIIPVIGRMSVKSVMPDDIKAVMARMVGKSASLHSKVYNTMNKIFDAALDNNYIRRNPCTRIKPGGEKTKEKEPLSATQQQTLIDAVHGTRAETFVMLGLYAGLRREEILGLKWDCVNLEGEAPYLAVKRALRWDHSRPVVSEELKSKAARRNIPIPEKLVEYLKPLTAAEDSFVVGGAPLSQQQFRNLWRLVERRQTGECSYKNDDGEVVTFNRVLGEKSTSASFCYSIDFDVTPHILRHTYITNLFLSGMDIKTVQYLAGHQDPQVTLKIYIHLMQNRPEDLIDQVKNAFRGNDRVNSESDPS